jgi:POTRA domain, ShlB-type
MAKTTEPAASPTNQLRSRRVLSLTCIGAVAALVPGCALLAYLLPAFAQAPRIGGARLGPGETRPELPEFAPEQPPEFELPPLPRPPPEREQRPSTGARVFVREFRLTGNTVFSDQELAAVLEPYTGRAIATEELLDARDAVTRLYIERGYVSSGAVIPDQDVVGGVIEIRIVERVRSGAGRAHRRCAARHRAPGASPARCRGHGRARASPPARCCRRGAVDQGDALGIEQLEGEPHALGRVLDSGERVGDVAEQVLAAAQHPRPVSRHRAPRP